MLQQNYNKHRSPLADSWVCWPLPSKIPYLVWEDFQVSLRPWQQHPDLLTEQGISQCVVNPRDMPGVEDYTELQTVQYKGPNQAYYPLESGCE